MKNIFTLVALVGLGGGIWFLYDKNKNKNNVITPTKNSSNSDPKLGLISTATPRAIPKRLKKNITGAFTPTLFSPISFGFGFDFNNNNNNNNKKKTGQI